MFKTIKTSMKFMSISRKWVRATGVDPGDKGQVARMALQYMNTLGLEPEEAWILSMVNWMKGMPLPDSQQILARAMIRFLDEFGGKVAIPEATAISARDASEELIQPDRAAKAKTSPSTIFYGKTLEILADEHGLKARDLAPKGSVEYKNLFQYLKQLRQMGVDSEFAASQLAYNYENYGSLTRSEGESAKSTGPSRTSVLDESVSASKKLSPERKMRIALLILKKECDLDSILERIGQEPGLAVQKSVIEFAEQLNEGHETLSPADLAVLYLLLLSETVRTANDVDNHEVAVAALSHLIQVLPAGSLTPPILEESEAALTNTPCVSDVDAKPGAGKMSADTGKNVIVQEGQLVTEEEIEDYGADLIDVIQRCCKEMLTLTVTSEDDLTASSEAISPDEIVDYGEELVELMRVVAENVRIELGGHLIHGHKCRGITLEDVIEYGEDLINVIRKIAFDEANAPDHYTPIESGNTLQN